MWTKNKTPISCNKPLGDVFTQRKFVQHTDSRGVQHGSFERFSDFDEDKSQFPSDMASSILPEHPIKGNMTPLTPTLNESIDSAAVIQTSKVIENMPSVSDSASDSASTASVSVSNDTN